MTRLAGDLVRHRLATHFVGQNIVSVQQTGSTNTELKKHAQRPDTPEGLLYLTDEQLGGRGRLERHWHAPPGSSLLMSLLFRPGDFLPPVQTQHLTMLCALAMIDAIEQETGLQPSLKWPNDLVWQNQKKLAGILTESEIKGDQLNWVVVGLGLNVNLNFNSSPPPTDEAGQPLSKKATSLSMILGRDTADLRLPILQRYLERVERRYQALRRGVSPQQEWQARLLGMGETVTVTIMNGAHRYQGTIIGLDKNGALLLQQADGTTVTIMAGDVTLRQG